MKNFFQLKSSRSGQALISALAAGGFVAVIATAVPDIIAYLNKQQQQSRVKALMRQVEGRLRLVFANRDNYTCDASGNCSPLATIVDRIENPTVGSRDSFKFAPRVVGALCPLSDPLCGVKASITTTATGGTATIRYTGTEVKAKDISFDFSAPDFSLQESTECISGSPQTINGIFAGFEKQSGSDTYRLDAGGNKVPICKKASESCDPGEILLLPMQGSTRTEAECGTIRKQMLAPAPCSGDSFITSIEGWKEDLSPDVVHCNQQKVCPLNASEGTCL